jgi:carboxyl-terminal processing protease
MSKPNTVRITAPNTVIAAVALALACVPLSGALAQMRSGPAVWSVPAYGYVIVDDGRSVSLYGRSGTYCDRISQMPSSVAASELGVRTDQPGGQSAVFSTSASHYQATRLPALPRECARPARSRANLATFDAVWTAMNEHYGFFDVRGVDWQQARITYRPRAEASRSQDELWTILTEMLAPLRDGHVTLAAGNRTWNQSRSTRATVADPDGIIPNGRPLIAGLQAWLTGPTSPLTAPPVIQANGRIMSGQTREGFCYLAVTGMGGYTTSEAASLAQELPVLANALDAIASQCAGARGTLIDLRYNPGGEDRLGLELASRFLTEPRPAWQKRALGPGGWTPYVMTMVQPTTRARLPGPVSVLIGERTISAAETTAVALQSAAGARLVGTPAQGALSDMLTRPLPNGWTLTLSNEDYAKPDGTRLEGPGLQPDIRVDQARPTTTDQRFGAEIRIATADLLAPR